MFGQSQCIKTGARVYLSQYGETIITDLFQLGNVYHFWIASEDHIERGGSELNAHLVVNEVHGPRRAGREVLALKACCVRQNLPEPI